MSIELTLFGEICLTRRWGRIGSRGQRMAHTFTTEREAVALFLNLLCQKRKRGYRPTGLPARDPSFTVDCESRLRSPFADAAPDFD
ncbi:WGR domain-containing protein [Bradyrhizobium brasilense]|uniref:WGR domain-containing protein n=1 Tax=Bradyrhizobium brasilense TaxID=1419277 RepID=A0A1G7IJD8_9BRAD|nr:WGR domain-containing protein [Bradyrhizobium australafricanum]MCC8974758.1 WGR domain-containing protein [Bradyrhizobium brasilense]SDF12870.1 WGR domain-containing protein [Bradyrhizobium brasilense]